MEIIEEKGTIQIFGGFVSSCAIDVNADAKERLFELAEEIEVVFAWPLVEIKFRFHESK